MLNKLNKSLYNLEGYFPLDRWCRNKQDGVGSFMIDKDIECKERNDLSEIIDYEVESIFVEVSKDVFQKRRKIIIDEIYWPPGESLHYYNEHWQTLLTKVGSENSHCHLQGDFNINILNVNKHNATSEFINWIISFCFIPLINHPTDTSNKT